MSTNTTLVRYSQTRRKSCEGRVKEKRRCDLKSRGVGGVCRGGGMCLCELYTVKDRTNTDAP